MDGCNRLLGGVNQHTERGGWSGEGEGGVDGFSMASMALATIDDCSTSHQPLCRVP